MADEEKAEAFNNFFASILTGGQASNIYCVPELLGRGWGSRVPPSVSKEHVWDLLMQLINYKSMRPDDIHPRVPKELT